MVRRTVTAAVASTAVALAVTVGASSGPASSVVEIAAAVPQRTPLLGVFWQQSRRDPKAGEWLLAAVDPRSLRPRRHAPRVRLVGGVDGWSFAPDGSRLALTVRQPVSAWDSKVFVRVLDASTLRLGPKIGLGSGSAYLSAWLADRKSVV